MSAIEDNPENYALFRDCLSTSLVHSASASAQDPPKRRRRARAAEPSPAAAAAAAATSGTKVPDPSRDAEELADFVEYLASEIFDSLPPELQSLDHQAWRDSEPLRDQYALPLTKGSLETFNLAPPAVETLSTYNLIDVDPLSTSSSSRLPSSPEAFLLPVLTAYITSATTPPPSTRATRTDACELCDRSWIPLSYHHLIPRFVHEKAVKRGWHRREDLQNVAWLCGACHRFVHNFKTHEELARSYYTVDLLLEEPEVRAWAKWVGKLRWKGR